MIVKFFLIKINGIVIALYHIKFNIMKKLFLLISAMFIATLLIGMEHRTDFTYEEYQFMNELREEGNIILPEVFVFGNYTAKQDTVKQDTLKFDSTYRVSQQKHVNLVINYSNDYYRPSYYPYFNNYWYYDSFYYGTPYYYFYPQQYGWNHHFKYNQWHRHPQPKFRANHQPKFNHPQRPPVHREYRRGYEPSYNKPRMEMNGRFNGEHRKEFNPQERKGMRNQPRYYVPHNENKPMHGSVNSIHRQSNQQHMQRQGNPPMQWQNNQHMQRQDNPSMQRQSGQQHMMRNDVHSQPTRSSEGSHPMGGSQPTRMGESHRR
jgi:hypothetical protein